MDATVLADLRQRQQDGFHPRTAADAAAPRQQDPDQARPFASILAVATSDEFKAAGRGGLPRRDAVEDADVMYTTHVTSADYADGRRRPQIGPRRRAQGGGSRPPSPTVGPIVYRYKGQGMAPWRRRDAPGAAGRLRRDGVDDRHQRRGLCGDRRPLLDRDADGRRHDLPRPGQVHEHGGARAASAVGDGVDEGAHGRPGEDAVDVACTTPKPRRTPRRRQARRRGGRGSSALDVAAVACPPTGATINISYVVPRTRPRRCR